ncbi:MAG: hypothetical protein K5669_07170 [Lachnospiraceae bacterium]|nr:hypothetical protein [Lachnospiraceae bacterium]
MRKDDDEEKREVYGNGEKTAIKNSDYYDNDDESKEKRGYRIHLIIVIAFNLVGAVLAVLFRHCEWDIPAELLNIIACSGLEILLKNRGKKDDKKQVMENK